MARGFTSLGAVIGALAVFCILGPAPQAKAQEITIALGSEPTTLDPQAQDDGGERAVNDNIYETLMARLPDGRLVPGLAAGDPTRIGPDTWRFKLRPGVKFTDGEPFDAAAVAFSVKRIIDPAFKSEQASFFSTIKDAVAVDALTVDIKTSGPDPILPARMYWMKMVPPKHAKDAKFASTPVGTGPYKLANWTRGDHITLVANPDYRGEKPQIKKVTYRFVGEAGTRLSGLLAGEFDLITNLLPEFVKQVPQAAHVGGLELPIVILSALSGPTKDVRVRQALNYAVDKQALAKRLYEGYATVLDGQLLTPAFFGYDKSTHAYPYDPAKAKALLKAAGAEGAAITLVGTSGRWLKDRELVESVAAYWQAVGLKVNTRIFEFDKYLKTLFDRKNRADAIFVVSSNELMDADRPFSAYYKMGGVGASNEDAALAKLIDEARTETDLTKRAALYHQAVERAHDQAYFLWLLNIQDIYGMSKRLKWQPRVDAKLLVKEMRVGG
jgi:peptide/nickel transport system substrate-binding protein